jgi:hypothetical protein
MNYCIVCPSCDSRFDNYEKFVDHIIESHKDQPSLRMKAKIIRNNRN